MGFGSGINENRSLKLEICPIARTAPLLDERWHN